MQIDHYEFGRIDIEGQRYTSDVIILPAQVCDHWWRKEGHRLGIEDLNAVLEAKPELLVVGTGYYGNMKIPDDTRTYLVSEGIQLKAAPTSEAVEEFNRLQREMANIVAALHLTC